MYICSAQKRLEEALGNKVCINILWFIGCWKSRHKSKVQYAECRRIKKSLSCSKNHTPTNKLIKSNGKLVKFDLPRLFKVEEVGNGVFPCNESIILCEKGVASNLCYGETAVFCLSLCRLPPCMQRGHDFISVDISCVCITVTVNYKSIFEIKCSETID